tara:strand:+ start:748 stop:921 length:174 start_codon:yes stop_codon:yes gene_type:complete
MLDDRQHNVLSYSLIAIPQRGFAELHEKQSDKKASAFNLINGVIQIVTHIKEVGIAT